MREGSIKQARKRKKRKRRGLIALLIFLLLVALAGVAAVKLFTVENVEVEGNQLYDDDLIAKTVLNDEYCWNTLYVYWKYNFQKVGDLPFIDTMKVSMQGPHTIRIAVYEKGVMGYCVSASAGGNVFFDKDGFVAEISSNMIPDVPRIEGIQCEDAVLYEKLPVKNSELRDILNLTQTLRRNDLIPESITYGVTNAPVLTYGSVRVQMGSDNLLTQKVERLAKILPTIAGESGVLHLENWTEETKNIVFDKDL